MYIDRIDLSISQEDLQSVMEAFASAAASLELLPSVSPSDRKRYAKLGLKNEALALQIIEVGRANRHLIPAGLDFGKIDRDLLAREQLRTLKVILQGLLDRVSDSMLLTGVDLYAAALSMYHCLRRNADTASLKTTVAELKKGFSRPSRKKKEEELQPVTASVSVDTSALDRNQPIFREAPSRCASSDKRRDSTLERSPGGASDSYEPVRALDPRAEDLPEAERHVPLPSLPVKSLAFGAAAPFLFCYERLPVFFSDGFTPTSPGYMHHVQAEAVDRHSPFWE